MSFKANFKTKKANSLRSDQPQIGKLVRELRQVMQLSQTQFADAIGMTFPTVNRWENGHATPSPLALRQIEMLLQQLGDCGEALQIKYFSEGERES